MDERLSHANSYATVEELKEQAQQNYDSLDLTNYPLDGSPEHGSQEMVDAFQAGAEPAGDGNRTVSGAISRYVSNDRHGMANRGEDWIPVIREDDEGNPEIVDDNLRALRFADDTARPFQDRLYYIGDAIYGRSEDGIAEQAEFDRQSDEALSRYRESEEQKTVEEPVEQMKELLQAIGVSDEEVRDRTKTSPTSRLRRC